MLAEEKLGVILLILSLFTIGFYFLLIIPAFNSINNSIIPFNEVRISDIHILMKCYSNTDFVVAQHSNIICKFQAYSQNRKYGTTSIGLHAYDSKNIQNKTTWWCNAFIVGINNQTLSDEIVCSGNVVSNDTFIPNVPTEIKFGISSLVAESVSHPGVKIQYSGDLNSDINPIEFFSPEMKVLSQEEYIEKEIQKSNLLLTLTVVLFASIGIMLQMVLPYFSIWKKRDEIKEEQKELIGNIKVWVQLIREATREQIKTLSKRKDNIPHWVIPEIDSSFYITRLKHFINKYETTTLKELIINAENKAKDINSALNLVKISDISKNKKTIDKIFKMIRERKYQFHSDLIRMTKQIEKELKILEGGNMVKKKKFFEKPKNKEALFIALFASLVLLLAQIGSLIIQWILELLAIFNIIPLYEKVFIAIGYGVMATILVYFIRKTQVISLRK